jgi:hypothetical protein
MISPFLESPPPSRVKVLRNPAGTSVLATLLLLALIALPAQAKKRALPAVEWGLSVSTAAVYNDNVLRLSDRDRNQFLDSSSIFPDPLKSADDIENETSIRPSLRWRAPFSLMASAQYTFKAVTRVRNCFTNYQTHTLTLGVRPRVQGYRWAVQFRAFTIPSFYLRAYRDRDFNEYHAARFANRDYSGTLKFRPINRLWLEAGAGYSTYYYNRKFTEYDSEVKEYSAGATYELPKHIIFEANYARNLSENVGKNQVSANAVNPIDPTVDTEYGDSDFNEDDFSGRVSTWLPWVMFARTDISLEVRHRRRVYTTDRALSLDPFHRGRLDRRTAITPGLTIVVTRNLDVNASFTYEERRTSSDHPTVSLAKNFIKREYVVTLMYAIR